MRPRAFRPENDPQVQRYQRLRAIELRHMRREAQLSLERRVAQQQPVRFRLVSQGREIWGTVHPYGSGYVINVGSGNVVVYGTPADVARIVFETPFNSVYVNV